MQVKDVMIPIAGSITPSTSLREASERMKALNIDPLPISEEGKVVGLLSGDELNEHARRDGLGAGSHEVREAMSTDVVCCTADDTVDDALHAVEQRLPKGSTTRVPVVDAQRRLVGLVSLQELRKHEHDEDDGVAAAQSVESVSSLVHFDEDRVDFMSDSSFPASDPIPAPTSLGSERSGNSEDT